MEMNGILRFQLQSLAAISLNIDGESEINLLRSLSDINNLKSLTVHMIKCRNVTSIFTEIVRNALIKLEEIRIHIDRQCRFDASHISLDVFAKFTHLCNLY